MNKTTAFFNALVQRYMPDPFVLAVFMLIMVVAAGFIWTPTTPAQMIESYGSGFWSMLAFSCQLSLILIASSALANTKYIKRPIAKLGSLPKTPAQAVFMVALVTSLVGLLNWGIALVVGVIIAKETAKRVQGTHYPLLIAASYIGFTLWSSGLSSSIPLTLNTPGNPIVQGGATIPLTDTIFTYSNLIISLALLFTYALVSRFMTPTKENAISIDPKVLEEELERERAAEQAIDMSADTPAAKMEYSRIISLIGGLACLAFFVYNVSKGGINALNLNTINMLLIGLGLCIYRGVKPYMDAITAAIKPIAPILMLYPFYGAISTLMTSTGIAASLTEFFANIATQETLPFLTYLSAGLLNLFIPAAGGQILVQGPIFLPIAEKLGVDPGLTMMGITYGDTWTNLLQPFWAMPALALAGLRIRSIMGFCITAMIVSGIVTGALLLILPFIL